MTDKKDSTPPPAATIGANQKVEPTTQTAHLSTLPVEDVLATDEASARSERDMLEGASARLDINLRRLASYGALLVSTIFFVLAAEMAYQFGLVAAAGKDISWHVVVPVLGALCSVPIVLGLAVLRSTMNGTKRDIDTESLHSAIATRVLALIDKGIDKLAGGASK